MVWSAEGHLAHPHCITENWKAIDNRARKLQQESYPNNSENFPETLAMKSIFPDSVWTIYKFINTIIPEFYCSKKYSWGFIAPMYQN